MMTVSIHAPRVGCDAERLITILMTQGFNSRTPCGVRLIYRPRQKMPVCLFQFTHPVWGATARRGL